MKNLRDCAQKRELSSLVTRSGQHEKPLSPSSRPPNSLPFIPQRPPTQRKVCVPTGGPVIPSSDSRKWPTFSSFLKIEKAHPSRWQSRQTWLSSSHNHIKITAKIENNHHSEPSQIELNGSLTTTQLTKPHPSRLVGGMEMQNRLVPHPCVVDKNLGGISQERGGPIPHQAPQPRIPVPGR